MKPPSTRTTIDWDGARRRLGDLARTAESAARLDPEKEHAVLAARAMELARVPPAPDSATDRLEVVTFTLAGERYALETRFIREIVQPREVTPVPGAADVLVGIMNLRGSVLAVMDLARLLAIANMGQHPWVIVLGLERAEFGLAAETINEVTELRADAVLAGGLGEAVSGLTRGVTGEAVIVLDGAALLEDPRLFIDDAT